MKVVTAILDITSGATGDKTIPDAYPAISKLLGAVAITAVADTGTGELTVTTVTSGFDVTKKDERTITIGTNTLSHSGVLVILYEPSIDLKTS